ncbi:MAG: hypothetical protein Q4D05_08585 [Acinetobacter sp.]|nr:hypothetical protein [Acinetobacter sp.]
MDRSCTGRQSTSVDCFGKTGVTQDRKPRNMDDELRGFCFGQE